MVEDASADDVVKDTAEFVDLFDWKLPQFEIGQLVAYSAVGCGRCLWS